MAKTNLHDKWQKNPQDYIAQWNSQKHVALKYYWNIEIWNIQ